VVSDIAKALQHIEDNYIREGYDSWDMDTFILPYHKIILDLSKEIEKLKEKNCG